ncbi:hypothetical protein [Bradyrhizobium roseum]|uniref:hypothetical protein n=1 Tax=Bradyrhizobium roseum TaxID=3056648 RepID=UPI0026020C75|nr:hypothetical protein [Bradyrhizobium roseus]WKA29538.1 hypothetical protein QUH67_04935 [Bradyrhizobium roseus]
MVGTLKDGAAIVQSLDQASAKLAELRAASDCAMGLPMSRRDPAPVNAFLPGLAAVFRMIDPQLNRLENQVAMADASLTALLNIAWTSQDLRMSAGGRVANMLPAIGTRRPLTAADISTNNRGQGRVDLDRERIGAGVEQVGSPPGLVQAMNEAFDSYFVKFAPWIEKEVATGRDAGKCEINSDQLTARVVPAVQTFFAVRDAALAEAATRAGQTRDGALSMLLLAGFAVLALLGFLAGVTVMLRRYRCADKSMSPGRGCTATGAAATSLSSRSGNNEVNNGLWPAQAEPLTFGGRDNGRWLAIVSGRRSVP